MKFTPNYPVMYGGERHPANVPFQITNSDAEEMKKHGTVEEQEEPQSVLTTIPEENDSSEKPSTKKPGRPKKEQ